MEGGTQVGREDEVPGLGRELGDRSDVLRAGIVDEDVGRPPPSGDGIDEGIGVVRPAEIGALEHHLDAARVGDLRLQCLDLVREPAAVENDPAAFRGQRAGDAETDAAGRAGNDRNLAVEGDPVVGRRLALAHPGFLPRGPLIVLVGLRCGDPRGRRPPTTIADFNRGRQITASPVSCAQNLRDVVRREGRAR